MSSVIEFLEQMGADAQLRHASQEDIAHALTESQIDSEVGAAIIAKSTADLYALLKLRPMFHIQNFPGPWPEIEEDVENEEEKKKAVPATE